MTHDGLTAELQRLIRHESEIYLVLNQFCQWVNASILNYHVVLETRREGCHFCILTVIESLDTLDSLVLGKDIYSVVVRNNEERLGPYQSSVWADQDPVEALKQFLANNPQSVQKR